MSIEALNWALRQPLRGCRKFVLVVLAYHANSENQCWPNVKTIAEECGTSRACAIYHLKSMEKIGLIAKDKRFDERGYRRSTLYTLNLNQSIENQRQNIQRKNLDDQGQNLSVSKVKNCDSNIIEIPLEQTREQVNVSDGVNTSTVDAVPINVKSDNAYVIFSHWQSVMGHPRAKLDNNRKRKIIQALKLGYSVDELKQAIDGCAKTPYNIGDNDRHQRYDDIELILRDAAHIERFITNAISPPSPSRKSNIHVSDVMTGVCHE